MTQFRPLDLETDATELARLQNYTLPEPVTAETVREWWEPRKDEIRTTTLALDKQGQAIGFWDVDRETWMRPGHWWLKVLVAPDQRGNGLGARMYSAALDQACQYGATHLESRVSENDAGSTHFAQKRGFQVERHTFVSTLDLTSFDEKCFEALLERVHSFRFFSLAEAGLTDENKHRLYMLNRATAQDNPGNHGTFSDYDTFAMNIFDAAWFRADTQILVADGDQWVGLTALSLDDEQCYAYNAFTGVLRDYRGRGLAQALKLHAILLARRAGMRYIRTDNDSQNAPVLAVNHKLGYQPESGLYQLLCTLE
jgi:GNAT superfamily N-acetyltransferase